MEFKNKSEIRSKVLVIEDDEMLNAGLCYSLQKKQIEAQEAYSIAEAKNILEQGDYDLALLDVNLPDGDGFAFAKELEEIYHLPFVFLTAHDLDEEVLYGFQLGADEYITKPFNIKIVMERLLAVLRRLKSPVKERKEYVCGNLEIDFEQHTVKKSGALLSLTPTEYCLLEFFCKNRNQVLTKEVLLENVWDNKGNYVNEHALTLNISRLRNKIADESFSYIKTIYGMGYQWIGGGNEQ